MYIKDIWDNKEYRKKIRIRFYTALVVATIVIAVHQLATMTYLYWEVNWFDIPMHIAGGFMTALFALTIFEAIYQEKRLRNEIVFAILFTLFVGIVWELLEWSFGLSGLSLPYRWDTIGDVINDVIGSGIAIIFWKYIFKFNDKIEKYEVNQKDIQ